MEARRMFQCLVFCNLVLYVVWLFAPFLEKGFISENTLDGVSWSGFGAILPMSKSVSWMLTGLYVITAFGVANFIREARWLFVAITIFQYGWVLFGGICAETAIEAFLSRANTLADGAIIALAFTPGLREKFERREPVE